MKPTVNLFWFRRDLRLEDNAGLYHALKDKNPVVPLFIFDTDILDSLELVSRAVTDNEFLNYRPTITAAAVLYCEHYALRRLFLRRLRCGSAATRQPAGCNWQGMSGQQ